MFRVETSKGYILFSKKEDADNYEDYKKNGLKIVGKSCGGWKFNDGSVLFDITPYGRKGERYSLHRGNRDIMGKRLQKKYIAVLNAGNNHQFC